MDWQPIERFPFWKQLLIAFNPYLWPTPRSGWDLAWQIAACIGMLTGAVSLILFVGAN